MVALWRGCGKGQIKFGRHVIFLLVLCPDILAGDAWSLMKRIDVSAVKSHHVARRHESILNTPVIVCFC